MKWRKRRRVEDTTDIASYISNHNVFSYLENKRSGHDGTSVADDFSNAGIVLTICRFFLIVGLPCLVFLCLYECLHMYNSCRTLHSCQSYSIQQLFTLCSDACV